MLTLKGHNGSGCARARAAGRPQPCSLELEQQSHGSETPPACGGSGSTSQSCSWAGLTAVRGCTQGAGAEAGGPPTGSPPRTRVGVWSESLCRTKGAEKSFSSQSLGAFPPKRGNQSVRALPPRTHALRPLIGPCFLFCFLNIRHIFPKAVESACCAPLCGSTPDAVSASSGSVWGTTSQ